MGGEAQITGGEDEGLVTEKELDDLLISIALQKSFSPERILRLKEKLKKKLTARVEKNLLKRINEPT